ncbi:MAG: transcriptional repressor LexA [Ignavibacteriae bacterium]|nr:transcriptional repressor LexA [Ignavibacteriota bacterium]MCB9242917.1 transcriptional repressor LexA [Ignavibacteriales bacterium]
MDKLTDKQSKILDFIREYTLDNPYPPTFQEIAQKFKITIGTVQDHISALQRKGYIERIPDVARGFKVVGDDAADVPQEDYMIPVYGNVAAGEPIFADDNIQGYIALEKNIRGHHLHFALKVKGDSMIDSGIYDGDIVIVKKQNSADDGDIIIALLDDEATVKTLRNSRINAYLEASNAKYKSIINKPFQIIGKVIELRRQLASA